MLGCEAIQSAKKKIRSKFYDLTQNDEEDDDDNNFEKSMK